MSEADYLIAAGLGAAGGFFDNQAQENAEAKARAQMERQAQLLMMKEERAAVREMRKQKDQQAFDLLKQKDTQEFDLLKQKNELTSKKEEAETKHGYDKELEGIKNSNSRELKELEVEKKSTDRQQAAKMKLRELIQEEKRARAKDFGSEGQPDPDLSWAAQTFPELYAEAYPDGAAPQTRTTAPPGSKFSSIFQKVTGAASKVKQGANDEVEDLPSFDANRRQ